MTKTLNSLIRGFAGVLTLWILVGASATAGTLSTDPFFYYNDPNKVSPPVYDGDPGAAFDRAKAVYDTDDGHGNSRHLVNLHFEASLGSPFNLVINGIDAYLFYDTTTCSAGNCNTSGDTGFIQTNSICSSKMGSAVINWSPPTEKLSCTITFPDAQGPPCGGASCLGNPIIGSTGQKTQTEADYLGPSGLDYQRTYVSTNGYFASSTTQYFLNNSNSAAYLPGACYPDSYTLPNGQGGTYCFPYTNTYPYVNGGVAQYWLSGADGRITSFTGPNSAVTQNVDINERVTQLTGGGAAAWQIRRADDSVELYDASGAMIQKTLRGGRVLTYMYSTASTPISIAPYAGLLISQSDAFGHTLSWVYNAKGQMTQMTDPAGGVYQYGYDSAGNQTSVVYPDLSGRTYFYGEAANTGGGNLPNALTGIQDESTTRYATFQYNSSGQATNTQHAGGVESYTFTYVYSLQTTVVDPLGTNRTYNFTQPLSYKLDSSQVQPAGSGSGTATKLETYDSNGNPASVTDFNGNVTQYTYDLTRNLETSRTEAYGTARARTISTQWNATWRQPSLITEPNRTTAFTYDSMGSVLTKTVTDTTVTPNVTRVWTYTYDTYGRVLTVDGPRTDVVDKTTYAYYTCTTGGKCGQLNTITNAASQVTTYNTYNAHGQPLTITDPNGVVTTLTYDARLRLKTRQVGTETTTYDYYPTGLVQKVTLPDSSYVQYTYDPAHRLTRLTDGAGNYVSYTLDNMGNRTAESAYDPLSVLSRTRSRVFDALNRLSQDIGAAGTMGVTTTYAYDNSGNQTGVNAPLSRNTSNQYDELNRLKQITDPGSGNTIFGYDANDNLISVQDPKTLTTSYTYNGFGDQKTLVSPDTGTTTNTYDSGGNLATSTDSRSAITTYTYDTLNRVKTAAYKIGSTTDQTITYTYDAGTNGKGRLTGASDANHSMSWAYDAQGRVLSKGQTVGTVTKTVGYAYTNGDLTTLTTPSGQSVVFAYANHRVSGITINGTTLLASVQYEPFGPARGWTWGNGTSEIRLHNTDGNTAQTSGLESVTYGYDNAFRITAATNGSNAALSWTYGYDALDRLTSASKSGTTQGWAYDANGNRLTQTGTVSGTYTISPTSNRLSSITGTPARTYTYSNSGGALTFGTVTNTYFNNGRMKTAKVGSVTTSYIYNALGQRVKKSGGTAGTVLFAYDESGHVVGEYDSGGNLVQETVWLDDTPVATLRPGTPAVIYYVHADQIGAPRMVTRPSDNKIAWRWDTDAFGTSAPNENPQSLGTFKYNPRFPGQMFDSETSINYNYFRDYDPQLGRYIESDPIGLNGGSYSTYAYGRLNPALNTDSSGLQIVQGAEAGAEIGSSIAPGPGTIIGGIIGAGVGGLVGYAICTTCPPCTPYPEGTIGYLGPHTDHDHFPIGRPHLNLFRVNQNKATCRCFWNRNNPDVVAPPPQVGWVNLNGGTPPLSP